MTAFAIIGFGEVGGIFARDLHAAGVSRLLAYDSAEAACVRAAARGYVEVRNTAAEAAAGADVVFVSVTAGSTVRAVASLSGGLGRAPFVVDVNSVSPTTKQEAARIVGQAGGRYVEAAVMTGVPPRGLRSPMLLGGPSATAFAELAAAVRYARQGLFRTGRGCVRGEDAPQHHDQGPRGPHDRMHAVGAPLWGRRRGAALLGGYAAARRLAGARALRHE